MHSLSRKRERRGRERGMHFDILTTNSSNARLLHAVKYSPNPVWPKVGPPTVVSATLHPQLSHCHTATLSTMPHCTQPLFQLSTSQRQNYFLPLITFCNNFQFSVYFRSGMMYKKLILKARYNNIVSLILECSENTILDLVGRNLAFKFLKGVSERAPTWTSPYMHLWSNKLPKQLEIDKVA